MKLKVTFDTKAISPTLQAGVDTNNDKKNVSLPMFEFSIYIYFFFFYFVFV